jgi:very-short-patch-repair endonuclease
MEGKKRTGLAGHLIARLAGEQHGVVARSQLRELGLLDGAIDDRIVSGHLQPLFRGTFAVGHRAVSRPGWMLAAALACERGTVLSHGSAAELLGLWDKRLPIVHVIPPDWSGRKISDIRWHRVRLPESDETTVRYGIPCTTISRTIVDMAGQSGWGQLRGLVEQAAILRLLDVDEIDLVLSRGRRRGAPRQRAVQSPRRGLPKDLRIRSRLEARLLPALIEEGLPSPRCNTRLQIDGRRLEIDMLWEKQKLAIETDGEETHGTSVAFQRDRLRDQLLLAAGYRTARITWLQVQDEPTAVVSRIAHMLQSNDGLPVRLIPPYQG